SAGRALPGWEAPRSALAASRPIGGLRLRERPRGLLDTPRRSDTIAAIMAQTLLDKVWQAHTVRVLPSGQTQLLIGLHLIHEVTTPQAFQMLREAGLGVRMPERTFATIDHIIPTTSQRRPFGDPVAEEMTVHLVRNCRDYGIPLFDLDSGRQ